MHIWLKKLALLQFKNYAEASFEFCPKINCLTGNNGTGKTNVLDAIHYLSLCKSYFTNIDSQNIKYDEELFTIQGDFLKEDKSEQVFCGVKSGQKKIFKRNTKEYEKLADHIGLFPVVVVSPADSSLILDGSEERRRFIDTVLSQFDPNYLNDLMRYNRSLVQRNQQLKDFDQKNWFDADMLAIWDDQLVDTGTRIHNQRLQFIEEMIPVFQKYYKYVSGNTEEVSLEYNSQLTGKNFDELLKSTVNKDRQLQYTSNGIHKDDLSLQLNGHPIKRAGSQGQQKTYLVALKLAQFEFIRKKSGNFPILLLDDIFDKFDTSRVNQIVKLVSESDFGQIFITDTSFTRMKDILQQIGGDYKLFKISGEGALSKQINELV